MTTQNRWERAFRRAEEVGAVARPAGRDRWAVESATKTGTVYLVEASAAGMKCSCTAAANGLPCFHVAAIWLSRGRTEPDRDHEQPNPAA